MGGGGDDDEPATVTVPSVVGQGVNDAVDEVDRAGPEARIESRTSSTANPTGWRSRTPTGGATAKEGDKVTLILPLGQHRRRA